MIKVKVFNLSSGEILGFEIRGHAGYDEVGKDIVCASVSSAAYMALNTLTTVMKVHCDSEINERVGVMRFQIEPKAIDSCKVILEGLKLHLIMLEEAYPKNISVSYEEVQNLV